MVKYLCSRVVWSYGTSMTSWPRLRWRSGGVAEWRSGVVAQWPSGVVAGHRVVQLATPVNFSSDSPPVRLLSDHLFVFQRICCRCTAFVFTSLSSTVYGHPRHTSCPCTACAVVSLLDKVDNHVIDALLLHRSCSRQVTEYGCNHLCSCRPTGYGLQSSKRCIRQSIKYSLQSSEGCASPAKRVQSS